MDISLIKPKIGHRAQGSYIDEGRMEPLMLGVLGALTPPEHRLRLIDDRFETIDFDAPCDLAAITVETFTARRAYEIAGQYRRRGVPVVMGGMHATLLPEEVAGHCDAVVCGDAEACWPGLLEDAAAGRLLPRYDGVRGGGLDPVSGCARIQLDRPVRRDLFAGKNYLPVRLLQFSRGCPNECSYCATSAFFEQEHYCRSLASTLADIGEHRLLFFVDDNLTANKEAAKELFRAMVPLKLSWMGQLSLEAADDDELLGLMAKSGCLGFVVGFESISADNVSWMKKSSVNSAVADAYRRQIARLKDHGFQIWAAFTLGHDFDTLSSIEDTVAFALKHRFTFAAFNILLPYPRTPLYERLAAEDRLLYDGRWWLHPEYRFNYAAFHPKRLSAAELTEAGMRARRQFNSFPSLVRRGLDLKTNLRSLPRFLYFLRYSLLFKREVRKKEGMIFGDDVLY